MSDIYYVKYLKYKNKYFALQKQLEEQYGSSNWANIKANIKKAKEATAAKVAAAKVAAGEQLTKAKEAAGEQLTKAKEAVGKQLTKAKEAAGEQLTKAKEAAGEQLTKAKEAVGEQLTAIKEAAGTELTNIKTNATKTVSGLVAQGEAAIKANTSNLSGITGLSSSELALAKTGLKFAAENPDLALKAAKLAVKVSS